MPTIVATTVDAQTGRIQRSFPAVGVGVEPLAADPTGNWLLGIEVYTGKIRTYRIDQTTGDIGPTVSFLPPYDVHANAAVFDRTGGYVFIITNLGYKNGLIVSYAFDSATGKLTRLNSQTLPGFGMSVAVAQP